MSCVVNVHQYLSEVAELETTSRGTRPQRLPRWVREQFPDPQLLAMAAQPSGVRIALQTSATRVELDLHPLRLSYAGADRPRGRVDLVVDGVVTASDELTGGDAYETDLLTGGTTFTTGAMHTAIFDGLPAGPKTVELWLPHNESVELLELRTDAPVGPLTRDAPLWLHYGSSISQGSNALSPTGVWPAVAARATGARLQNLGFGGNALLDPFMARAIRDAPADVVSLKVGINIVNLDSMRLRTLTPAVHGFLDTIRDGHPTTPLLLVTPIFCGIHESTPGPGSVDASTLGTGQVLFTATGDAGDTRLGKLTLQVIRQAITEVVERRLDPNLHLIDGLSLYGGDDAVDLPLPDALHPDTATHQLIGSRFARVLEEILVAP